MSVTTSSANVEPPPLLFGQRSPSSPSFSSPPQSPNHLPPHSQNTQSPVATPQTPHPHPPISEDIDMSTSAVLPPPNGQDHDRQEDALMQDSESLTNGNSGANTNAASTQDTTTNNVAVGAIAVNEDTMDTTPDDSQALVIPNSSTDLPDPPAISSTTPAPNADGQEQSGGNHQPEVESPEQPIQQGNVQPVEPPPPLDPTAQPPPPPDPVRSDSESSDDDDNGHPWHPIPEDTSSPDEAELKEIESSPEFSALDHDHWESKAFTPLDAPEYTAGPCGRIEWTIENYNGTKETPNRELVMKSPPVTIGGYEWQIKFYPKGNDSDYLSVYVECLTVAEKKESKSESEADFTGEFKDDTKDDAKDDSRGEPPEASGETSQVKSTATDSVDRPEVKVDAAGDKSNNPNQQQKSIETQHAPLPLLDMEPLPKRRCVAAQVSVVLYNPEEPRVNYSRTCLHRFCTGSPDWGWTRFHGPYYDISHRLRLQRQALLRNDKLKFTGYIRIVEDETNCLWEHHSRDNPWDSFAMTGLQSLALSEVTNSPGGNFISAVASWMLFKPFRQFLYNFEVPDPEKEPLARPKPLIAALQKVLYMLRTQVKPGAGPVTMEDVLDGLEWYGITEKLEKLDVIAVWELLRSKIEEELRETPQASLLEDLFGPKKDYSLGTPSYRAPVLNVGSMQEAINVAPDLIHPSAPLPQLLTIELARQEFDVATRSYVKLMNRVSLDEHITIKDTPYTLFGFVVHKQTLQSYIYHPVLRPEGPGSKWYHYTDGREENMVKCLTRGQAIDAHEGKSGSEKVIGNDPVAYIVMYVRDDVATSAFTSDAETEKWHVAGWIREEIENQRTSKVPPPMPPPPMLGQTALPQNNADLQTEQKPAEEHEYQVIDSRVFLGHEGPGIFDAYDTKWQAGTSDLIRSVRLSERDSLEGIREKLASVLEGIKNPRQIKFWFADALRGSFARPNLHGTGVVEFSSGSIDHYMDHSKVWKLGDSSYWKSHSRIWVHVIDVADITPIPEVPKAPEPSPAAPVAIENHASVVEGNAASVDTPAPPLPPHTEPTSEDTPMSEPEDAVSEISPPQPSGTRPEALLIEIAQVEAMQPETLWSEIEQIENAQAESAQADIRQDPENRRDATLNDVEIEVEVAVEPAQVIDPPAVDVVIPNTAVPDSDDTEMGGTQEDLPPPPPPPPADFHFDPGLPPPIPPHEFIPPPAPIMVPDEIYFFLKFFDPESQRLEARGSHICAKSARLDNTISSLLGLSSDKKIEIHEEEDLVTTHLLKGRHSFSRNDVHNGAVLIATFPLSEEKINALADRAAFADPQSFLTFRAQARNFPTTLTGHFTLNYFSSQYYKGEFRNGHRHGHGRRIYHSGATYEGSFRLSQRHGHGLYTFQNGDTYDGDWVANQQHGTGTFVESATGNTYVGGWKNDKKFGEGVTHWKNAQEAERLCRICWEENADAAFYDCGHVVACLGCARRVENCPVCRKRVMSAMKLFYVS